MKPILIIFLLLVIAAFVLSSSAAYHVPDSEDEIVQACYGKSLKSTASCLVSNTKTFYKYNFSISYDNKTFSELKISGGDCYDYSLYYERLGKRLGFFTSFVNVQLLDKYPGTDRPYYHQAAVISNIDGYCVLDQDSYLCQDLGGSL